MAIKTISVIGDGTMDSGIAQVTACAGFDAMVIDVSDAAVGRCIARVTSGLEGKLAKDKMGSAEPLVITRIGSSNRLTSSSRPSPRSLSRS